MNVCVVVATGVNVEGQREILDLDVGTSNNVVPLGTFGSAPEPAVLPTHPPRPPTTMALRRLPRNHPWWSGWHHPQAARILIDVVRSPEVMVICLLERHGQLFTPPQSFGIVVRHVPQGPAQAVLGQAPASEFIPVRDIEALQIYRNCSRSGFLHQRPSQLASLLSTTVAHDRPEGRAVLKIAMSSYGVLALLLSEQS